MFSGCHHETKRQADGWVFIDRDGEMFRFILQFLRDGDLNVAHLDQGMRERLKSEAAFFCLTGLEEKLLAATTSAAGLPDSVLYRVRLYDSVELGWYDSPSKEDPLGILYKMQLEKVGGAKVYSTSALIELHAQAGYGLCSFSPHKDRSVVLWFRKKEKMRQLP